MNYENILNMLKGNNYTSVYTTWYNDDEPMKKSINDTIRSIWYSDGRTEIEVKEEKKNGKTEPEVHPDDGCIYW
jgi:hypothetical protein